MSIAPATRLDDPYVGPVAFGPDDPLYGRDRERDELLDLLIAERIVLLYSPSGAGKSSLIEAALVPALREAGFEVLPTVRVTHTLPPGSGMPAPANRYVMSVLLSLEEGVPPEMQRPVEALAGLTLKEYLASFADRDGRPGNEVLIFDQFEEVLTADPTDEAAKHVFFRQLGDVLRDRGHWALLSMREDFLAALDPYLRYLPTRLRTTYRLDLLSVSEALEAIRRPAERAGVEFAEDAAQQLVDDLRIVRVQRADGVREVLGSYVEPVQLQVACHLLWSMLPPDATAISRADVEALGRVDQALAEYYAERVAVAAERTGIPERVIRDWFDERLITPQGLRSQVLQGPDTAPEAASALLADLMDAHLLRAETRRQATWYELAHDRLIEPVRRDNAAWRESHLSALERAALLWEQEGKPDRLLLVGAELAGAEQSAVERQDAFDSREREFLDASRRADAQARKDVETAQALTRSARRLRITAIGMSVLAVASLVLLGNSLVASQQAAMQSERAAKSEETTLLLLGLQESMAADEYIGGAMAAEVAGRMPLELAREALFAAAQAPVERAFRGQVGPVMSAAFSKDGATLVTAGGEDIQLWDWRTGEPGERIPLADGEAVTLVDLSDDGRTVVAGMQDGTALLWRVDGGEPTRWDTGQFWVWSLDVSPDGARIASTGWNSGTVEVWDIDTSGDAVPSLERTLTIPGATYRSIALFAPDSSLIATSSDVPEVRVWDVGSGLEVDRLALPSGEGAWGLWFAEEGGSTLATWTNEAVTVWNLDGKEPVHEPYPTKPYTNYNVNGDLSVLLEAQMDGTISVIDLKSGLKVAGAEGRGAELCCAGFGPDGEGTALVLRADETAAPAVWRLDRYVENTQAVTATTVVDGVVFSTWDDQTLHRWQPGEEHTRASWGDAQTLFGVVQSLSGDEESDRLIGVTNYYEVAVWDGLELTRTYDALGYITAAALLPGGREMVLGDDEGAVGLWDVNTGWPKRDLLDMGNRPVNKMDVSPDGSRTVVTFGHATESGRAEVGPEPVAAVVAVSGDEEVVWLTMPADQRGADATAVGFSADGRRVLIGTSGGTVVTFDSSTGDQLETVQAHHHPVRDVVDVRDAAGSMLTTGGSSGARIDRVVLVDEEGNVLRTIPSRDDLIAATLSADGESVVMFTADGVERTVPIDDEELFDLVERKVAYDLTPSVCAAYGVSGC